MEKGSLNSIKDTDISMVPRICPKCGNLLIEKHRRKPRWICFNPQCDYFEEEPVDNLGIVEE